MFEALIIGLLLETLADGVLQFVVEIFVEIGSLFFRSLKKNRLVKKPVAMLGLAILGGVVGFASMLVLPGRLFPFSKYSGISLLLAPLLTGAAMYFFGSWRQDRGRETTLLATFWGGALFAFCMALARWLLISR